MINLKSLSIKLTDEEFSGPNWQNSVQIATKELMIGHALLNTNFNLGVHIPAQVGEFFIFKNYMCKLPLAINFNQEKTLFTDATSYLTTLETQIVLDESCLTLCCR